MKKRLFKRDLLGYCPKCGRNVAVDYCDHCQMQVQKWKPRKRNK